MVAYIILKHKPAREHMKQFDNPVRRKLAHIAAFGAMSFATAFSACNSPETEHVQEAAGENQTQNTETSMVYIGTYSDPENESIFLHRLNPQTGELSRVNGFKAGANPSFLTLDEERRHLYAVNETGDFQGQKSGAVSAFSVDQQTGNLTLLNQVPSLGGAPCYIAIGGDGKIALVANYMGGNVAAFPIQENGQLAEAADMKQHKGKGPNKDRQEAAHAHYIAPSPDNRYIYAVDLGTDKVMSYRLEADKGTLAPAEPAVAFAAKPGAGPRQMAFHPNGKVAYLINELNSTMTALSYNPDNGTLSEIQTLSTLPADHNGDNFPAAVRVSPDGKHVYGSNRGHNSIVVYTVDASTGKLTYLENVSTGGDWPRDFTIDLTGEVMLVANERSNNIVSFNIDKATGKLTATGHEAEVQKPVCVQVVPAFSQE